MVEREVCVCHVGCWDIGRHEERDRGRGQVEGEAGCLRVNLKCFGRHGRDPHLRDKNVKPVSRSRPLHIVAVEDVGHFAAQALTKTGRVEGQGGLIRVMS